ncbi:hypothetical protein EX30DRAFT_374732 [Ascodesmis nigricans]|uniref:HAM1-like N-terminal domain-containing protein n=1 Tax=Ascodesmis nigricans TaxID=341454 RepID=A0A4S2MK29_9PEZI|nr:hypothetical protein EX30DRAFT_374732 [Ascodesmis nigricans]
MLSWLGFGRSPTHQDPENTPPDADAADENTPLLPDIGSTDETALQRNVHKKLHTYLMLKALSQGYLPSTQQACAHLRQFLATDVLNPTNTALTPSGRTLVRDVRRFIQSLITLLETKNSNDELQEFIWCTSRARAGFDGAEIVDAVSEAGRAGTGVNAGLEAVKTVAELLMGNREFRGLVEDVVTVARLIVSDTAEVAGEKVKDVAEVVRPEKEELEGVGEGAMDGGQTYPGVLPAQARMMRETGPAGGKHQARRPDSPEQQLKDVAEAVEEGIVETAQEAVDSTEHALKDGHRGEALLERLKRTVLKLRAQADYTDSVNIISTLLKRYAIAYSRSISAPAEHAASAVHTNSALDEAASRLWSVITSFGDKTAWDELLRRWGQLLSHLTSDIQFEALMNEIGDTISDILTNPSFADSSALDKKLQRLRDLAGGFDTGPTGSLKTDLDTLLSQCLTVLSTIAQDPALTSLTISATAILDTVSPPQSPHTFNPDLASDLTHVLAPRLLELLQHIPLLRLTVCTRTLTLLLENIILEPGDTIAHSSFFPHNVRIDTLNALELRKHPRRYTSSGTTTTTITLRGLTLRAEEIGYYIRLSSPSLSWLGAGMWDEGIISIFLDDRGIDLTLTITFSRSSADNIIALRDVAVKVNTLNYTLHRSRFRWLVWPAKPLLRPIIRRILKSQLESGIRELARTVNREVVFARERLRAVRVARPRSWGRFVRAVASRFRAPEGGEVEVRVGRGEGRLEGRYAPGSLVGLWEREGEGAGEWVRVGGEGGWRNRVFAVGG